MQGGIPIVTCDCFSHAGQYHIRHGLPNEDHLWTARRDGIVCTAVCDGAGGLEQGGTAALLVSRLTAEYLCTEFATLYSMDFNAARRHLSRVITIHLRTYADAHAIPMRQLATTILAAAIDDQGRCLCFHLGDGIIMRQKSGQTCFDVVSSPRNGPIPYTTYLTMNCNLWEHLRLHRWIEPASCRLLLMTDGAMEHLTNHSGSGGWQLTIAVGSLRDLEIHLQSCTPADDYSCAIISLKMRN